MMFVRSFDELGRMPEIGDRVKIADARVGNHWNPRGEMDKWLGKVMTVIAVEASSVYDFVLKLRECRGEFGELGWNWYPWMIEGLAIECVEDIVEDPSTWASDVAFEALLS